VYSTMMACKAYVYAVGQACDRAKTPEAVRALRKDAAGAILYSAEKATWMAGRGKSRHWAAMAISMNIRLGVCGVMPSCMNRRRHQRDSPDADRPRIVCRNQVNTNKGGAMKTANPDFKSVVERCFSEAAFVADIGITYLDCGPGWCESRMPITERHLQNTGVVHAGAQTTLADHTAGAAGVSLLRQVILSSLRSSS